jgi:superfamily I DNA and/or RNA helicase
LSGELSHLGMGGTSSSSPMTEPIIIRHEHLYTEVAEKVIRSSDFVVSRQENENLLDGVRVILCTLSMITNPTMIRGGYTNLVPLRTLIVDEASQIEIGSYLPVLSQSASSLEKIVFIGDDKQRT